MENLFPYPLLPQMFIGFLFFLISLYLLRWQSIRHKSVAKSTSLPPPEVCEAWPILGHLHLIFGGLKPPHVTFSDLADKYGPIFIFRLGKYPALVVSHRDVIKELFATKDLVALTRPKFIQGKHLGYDGAMFGFSEYGLYWREIRKIVSVELLSAHRLQLLNHVRFSETETSIKELYKFWVDHRNKDTNDEFVLVEMNKCNGSPGTTTTTDHHGGRDFMDVMISLFEKADNAASYDADTIIKSTCIV
ncbi:OLC1v1024348C1 [Oldenlandia corymbosa var. corymbosa]|uniref:OLC1v1024348C1 n=1 Tax=Oldenlandia corymbosa var. corymbosa TaxID=529605 RepID=A0AAV1C315_OLDCO|nr:OLC1v1024348C1 [Oldenlandia corymbosa var. corymbosa]